MLLDFLLAGLVIGGIYALIAIGLNLQYGVARVLNLAYGEFLMLAGYAAFWAFTLFGAPPLLTMLAGAPLAFGLSWLLFRFVLHPLLGRTADQGKREVNSILSTFGLLFVLQGVALVAWTGTDRSLQLSVHTGAHLRHRHGGQPADRADRRAGAVCRRLRVPALFPRGSRHARHCSQPAHGAAGRHRREALQRAGVRHRRCAGGNGRHPAVVIRGHQPDHRRSVHGQGADRHRHGRHRPCDGRSDRRADPGPCRDDGGTAARPGPRDHHQLRHFLHRAAVAPAGLVRRQQQNRNADTDTQACTCHHRAGSAAVRAVHRQYLLAVAGHQPADLYGACHRMGLLLRPDPLRVARRVGLLRRRRLCDRRAGPGLFLPRRPAGCRRHRPRALRLRRPRHPAPVGHVLRDLHLRPRLARQRGGDMVGVQHRQASRLAPVPVDHYHAHLLPVAGAVCCDHRALDHPRPQPHGLRVEDAGRRRDRRAPDRHQHRLR